MFDRKQLILQEAMRRADPDKPGDLIRKLRELDPEVALQVEVLTLMGSGLVRPMGGGS